MIRLRRIRAKNFRTFKDLDVELPERGLVLLKGVNKDTGGSSDSGKTNFNLAINYALGTCPLPATTLQRWGTKKATSVQLDMGDFVVDRSPGSLGLVVGGKPEDGLANAMEKRLDDLIGYDAAYRAALTYREQRERGTFFSKTDQEKKEFLGKLLGLERYEAAVELAQSQASTLRPQVQQLESKLATYEQVFRDMELDAREPELVDAESLQASWENLQGARASLIIKRSELQAQADAEAAAEEANYKALQAKLALARADRDKQVAQLEAAARAKLQEVGDIKAAMAAFERDIAKEPALRNELANLHAEKAALDNYTCPTCRRQWDSAPGKKDEVLARAGVIWDALDQVASAKDRLAELKQRLNQVQSITSEIAVADVPAELEKQLQTSRLALLLKMSRDFDVDGDIAAIDLKLAQAQSQLAAAKATNAARLEAWEKRKKSKEGCALAIEGAKKELQATRYALEVEEDFAKILGREGFLGAIFEEVLDEISEEVNRILANVPNVATCTFRFASEKQLKKGGEKRAIIPTIHRDGQELPFKAGCSGGMQSAIELAVDLALTKVVARRTGKDLGWLILDECFEGLGKVEKEGCLEMLKEHAADKLVIVVDHASEFQEFFSKVIVVEKSGNESKVKEQ